MLITDAQDRALLGHQAAWPDGRFSTLAGFVEPGETAEQAVRREVAEEAGVVVVDVQLLASQPWPFPSSLMIGATGRVDGTPDPHPDGDEMAEVRWFTRDELRAAVEAAAVMVPGPISISRWLIDRWFGDELPDQQAGWR
jgi:NAD+ diphosphatase